MSITPAEATDLFRRPPDHVIDVDGVGVAHRRIGTGPDVLFVHGWPVSGATFRALLPHLVDHVTCHVLDLPGAGSSRFSADSPVSIDLHIRAVRAVVDELQLGSVAVVGHDSGGMIARHALAGDQRVRAFGLIDTEQTGGSSLLFRTFLSARHLPGFGAALGSATGRRRLRRSPLLLGGAFVDRSLLDGEFDELFLEPLRSSAAHRAAATRLLRSFRYQLVRDLADVHRRIDVPVQLVWGAEDPFFPVQRAEEMVGTFARASLAVVAGAALFAHEEKPAEVAAALLPTLLDRPADRQ